MKKWLPLILVLWLSESLPAAGDHEGSSALEWSGDGQLRLVVDVSRQTGERTGDLRPAEVVIDFPELLDNIVPKRLPDLETVQVIRHDTRTGKPLESARFAFGRNPWDLPWRWYDDAIDYEFPEVVRAIDQTKDELRYETRTRFGYFYDCIGDWKSGHLAFVHQVDERPARYAVYFDLLPESAEPEATPPRGFLGDGLQRCTPRGTSTTGLIHSRLDIVDWNNDGLFDLVVGCGRGGMVWYPNRGRVGEPQFPFSKLVSTSDGRPLDVGWSAAPHVVDWDGDGLFDLLVGAEWNRLLFYRNRGRAGEPELEYAGPIRTAAGKLLTLPIEPVPESPEGVFKRDYYPVVETADWDDDGDLDLLAGGYVTGRVFLFENMAGRGKIPELRSVGPIEADGTPLDVGWCAAPAVADLDGDGDLDLISGCMPVTARGGDAASSKKFLHWFINDGSRTQPQLRRVEFPRTGSFPRAALGTPRLVDFSGDGLLDLAVSAGKQIYLFRNIGQRESPRYEGHANPLPSRWGSASLPVVQLLDFNGDGLLDGLNGTRVYINTGRGSPGIFRSPFSLLKPGQTISHLSGIGDDWRFQRMFDLDADGRLDLMDADHGGHVWWHRNRGTREEPEFDLAGIRLMQVDGQPVRVGLNRSGFDALQGARATYTVGDFDNDGLNDLVVADTFGIVRYFHQGKVTAHSEESDRPDRNAPRFDEPLQIGKLRIRCVPYAADWNGDGRLDVVAGSSTEDVVVFLNRGDVADGSPFGPATKLDLPSAPYGAGAPLVVGDFNADGDADLIVNTAYGYTCFYERSFIESGYARANVIRVEQRPNVEN